MHNEATYLVGTFSIIKPVLFQDFIKKSRLWTGQCTIPRSVPKNTDFSPIRNLVCSAVVQVSSWRISLPRSCYSRCCCCRSTWPAHTFAAVMTSRLRVTMRRGHQTDRPANQATNSLADRPKTTGPRLTTRTISSSSSIGWWRSCSTNDSCCSSCWMLRRDWPRTGENS